MQQILIIDDDRTQCLKVATYLKPLGFEVTSVHSGPEGVEQALAPHAKWSAIILDVVLPGFDGFEVLKRIRSVSRVPVIMLTGQAEETDRIVGLEIGADDYIPKTFSSRELLARLRSAIRRGHPPAPPPPPPAAPVPPAPAATPDDSPALEAGPLQLNVDARTAMIEGEPLLLTPVEFDLLASLIKSPGRVKTREALLDEIRERNYDVFDRSIDVHISSLRKKLKDHPKHPRFIRTVRTAGYMLLKQQQKKA